MSILGKLTFEAKQRCDAAKQRMSSEEIRKRALLLPSKDFVFENALKTNELSFICECKKSSPSKGIIAPDFPHLEIAKAYESAGANCISVLTEPIWFLGNDKHLKEIADAVSIPCLRKDFIIDEYMIYEARLLGASAVLLICSILSEEQIRKYIDICDTLGLSALVEVHDEKEIMMALGAGARMIGINNRNLKDFSMDTENSRRLAKLIPENVIFVSESGVSCREDIERLSAIGADAVLIGETLMRAVDKKAKLAELRGCGTKIKFCGLTREEDIDCANDIKPDYVGFVFAPKSRRHISSEKAFTLRMKLNPSILAVGIFVDAPLETVVKLLDNETVDIVQLHGTETEDYISRLRTLTNKLIIQAFRIDCAADAERAKKSTADFVLLDGKNGGSGKAFDWDLIKSFSRPFFLAGGLTKDNAPEVIKNLRPYALDVSSGIEADGYKNKNKMRGFAHAVRGKDVNG